MSKSKIERRLTRVDGSGSTKQHHQGAQIAASTSSCVVSVSPQERRILIGPNGRTLRKLLAKHSVRMSLSRGGRVTVLGQEQRVAHAVAHISWLLRDTATGRRGGQCAALARDSFRQGYTIRSRRVQAHIASPQPEDSSVAFMKGMGTKKEMLQSLGRRLGAAIRKILDFVTTLPHP